MKTETDISLPRKSADSLLLRGNNFNSDSEADHSFANLFEKYENVFRNNLTDIPDDVKLKLLQKLGLAESEKLRGVIHSGLY
ncbi:unnamed protein product [Hymenolepis diminuta]|uniref:Uncharacterized protein n=1 Tax=Hymenolepis diminuta TaxID=6216 RepID=A0A564Z6Q5_HYMDI|nr:unnamed protein product [Hymenolepis diminuta]